MTDIKSEADKADMIVGGYAFTKSDEFIRVLNLNTKRSAAVLDTSGNVIETSMNDIELDIVKEYFKRNKSFLED